MREKGQCRLLRLEDYDYLPLSFSIARCIDSTFLKRYSQAMAYHETDRFGASTFSIHEDASNVVCPSSAALRMAMKKRETRRAVTL